MRQLTTTTPPEAFLGGYGPRPRTGLLSEHLELYKAAGGVVRQAPSGRAVWAVVEGRAYPVVCSELVELWTEDGRETGRCGELAVELGCCEGHAEQLKTWRAQSEAETVAWERDREEMGR